MHEFIASPARKAQSFCRSQFFTSQRLPEKSDFTILANSGECHRKKRCFLLSCFGIEISYHEIYLVNIHVHLCIFMRCMNIFMTTKPKAIKFSTVFCLNGILYDLRVKKLTSKVWARTQIGKEIFRASIAR